MITLAVLVGVVVMVVFVGVLFLGLALGGPVFGDPYYTVWVVNDAQTPFIVETRIAAFPEPSDIPPPEAFTHGALAPPGSSGAAVSGPGEGSLKIVVMTPACEVVAQFDVPAASVHVVAIDTQGTPRLLTYEAAFDHGHSEPAGSLPSSDA